MGAAAYMGEMALIDDSGRAIWLVGRGIIREAWRYTDPKRAGPGEVRLKK